MLHAADILVDRQPAVDDRPVGRLVRMRRGEAGKIQDESTKVSMVSVSRWAGPPQDGQATFRQAECRSSGLPGRSNSTSSGSLTGRSARGTGTTPHFAQWIIGIGQPQ